ncbi:glutamyl-tRNA reductase [Lentzea tibetensis]|uniref:Glutamyl-tRNA reductase n=1 Tax=Lentzea tibetensis TaxID=2591470 RepID=A0A563F3F4_9PSEU|nr:glutamyl-tRNA reductase [Lentzea tibetensis]TWP54301.1 glutamyl-tRNA reductase [Lentzea tibetensis]
MNLLVVGVSHRTAPVSLLERIAVRPDDLVLSGHVREAMVLSTCNRVEIVAAVNGFHGALAEIGGLLAAQAGMDVQDLAEHLTVSYDDEAVRHVFRVASGLDSMVVGEAQIQGQLRDAYARAADTVGSTLHELVQQALKTGKRVRTETRVDEAGRSVVTAALELGLAQSGITPRRGLVVGTGAMGRLALATLRRAGIGELMVAGRTPERIAADHEAVAVPLSELHDALDEVDVVVSATASPGEVITRVPARRMLILDLAVPRDVDPAVADAPGVTLIDMTRLGAALTDSATDVAAADAIVAEEVDGYLRWLRASVIAPTVATLRNRAEDLVGTELAALRRRRPELTEDQRADVARTVRRVVRQLLHQPTVRVRELAAGPDGDRYASLIRELFDPEYNTNGIKRALDLH